MKAEGPIGAKAERRSRDEGSSPVIDPGGEAAAAADALAAAIENLIQTIRPPGGATTQTGQGGGRDDSIVTVTPTEAGEGEPEGGMDKGGAGQGPAETPDSDPGTPDK